jgi:RNA polymerase sigma-70 factor (ECF subfamily)
VHVIDGQAAEQARADLAILERIVARDQSAVAELYDRHSRLLFSLIVRIIQDRSEAEEVLQEVFLTVWTKVESYDASLGTPVGWLVRIARNRGIDRLRTNVVRTRTLGAIEETRVVDNPETSAARSEQQRRVRCALDELPPEQRTLIEHAYFRGLTHSELAEQFRLPLGTVKTRVRTGLQALRQHLGRQDSPYE